MTPAQVADRLGLKRHPRSWRGACPACGYSAAFTMRVGRGDRLHMLAACGCARHDVEDAVRKIAGGDAFPARREATSDIAEILQHRRDAARRTWDGSMSAIGTIADTYLSGRGLPGLAVSAALRFRPDASHPEGGRLPAMVAKVVDAAGTFLAVHRTFLRPDGSGKTDREPQRASLGSQWGGAIRLAPVAPELVVGEGIETSASAGRLLNLPAWAAISAWNLAQGLMLPPEVRAVVIAADADAPGERAAEQAQMRWSGEGRTVRIATPNIRGRDFNDVLRGHGNG
jgi:phage/plasmid primase-like uncharacterized protein